MDKKDAFVEIFEKRKVNARFFVLLRKIFIVMSKTLKILLALLCGGLLTAAWPTWGIAPLVFIAFVPLLLLEDRIAQGEKGKLFWISFLAFFVWNVATT